LQLFLFGECFYTDFVCNADTVPCTSDEADEADAENKKESIMNTSSHDLNIMISKEDSRLPVQNLLLRCIRKRRAAVSLCEVKYDEG
jgi:hypothetical protein